MNWLAKESHVKVGARGSNLSKKQVLEVEQELQKFHPNISFDPVWLTTTGDLDLKRSLRDLENSDFFSKEIDEAQLKGHFQISIHSAKDLPNPLREGLILVALTKGLDSSDVLVMPPKKSIETLGKAPRIGTSSLRREQTLRGLIPDAQFVDIRGTIEKRLELMTSGVVDALVMAEAAILRLELFELNRVKLPGPVAAYQGQLAVVARSGDEEMERLFACIDSRATLEHN